jgi:hypothetical protein
MTYKTGYKIIDISKGFPRYLFKGLDGTRTIKQNTPLHAEIKQVNDGGVTYTSGFHVLPEDLGLIKKYVSKFKKKKGRAVIKVRYKNHRPKPTKGSLAILANTMILRSKDVPGAIPLESL